MFVGKAESVVEVCVVENDVTVQMLFIIMNRKHILVVALQETVAKFLSDLQGLFRCNFIRSETLNYVVCENLCSSCAVGSDGSESIRLHI